MRGLFLTCTENSFFYSVHTYKNQAVGYSIQESNLLRKAIPCSWRQIPHPLRSLAWSQLPLRPCISLTPRTCFPPTEYLFYIKVTLTSPILLSGTLHSYSFFAIGAPLPPAHILLLKRTLLPLSQGGFYQIWILNYMGCLLIWLVLVLCGRFPVSSYM